MLFGCILFGNCDTRICLGATDSLTAQYFSDLIGVSTVENETIRKPNSIEEKLEYGQKNISTLKRNLINPDEILRLPNEKLIVNVRGNKPILLDKMIYTEHKSFNKLQKQSISEYNPLSTKNEKDIIKQNNNTKRKIIKNKETSFEDF